MNEIWVLYGALLKWCWQRETEMFGEKPVSLPLFFRYKSHMNRTQSSAMRASCWLPAPWQGLPTNISTTLVIDTLHRIPLLHVEYNTVLCVTVFDEESVMGDLHLRTVSKYSSVKCSIHGRGAWCTVIIASQASKQYFVDYCMLIVALSASVRWEGDLWRKTITKSERAVNGFAFCSSQEVLAGGASLAA
jgi:hypothetical protein